MFTYKKALCRHVPKSLVTEALRMENSLEPIDYENALREHKQYIETLGQLGLQIVLLDADEELPDCVFVEDPAIVCGDKALVTNPGHTNRKKETIAIKTALEKLVSEVVCMENPAEMDGGDVLFTGKEFFVGLSTRTNQDGADVLRSAFPLFPVHTIRVIDATLHLKSMLSLASDDVIAYGPSKAASEAVQEMKEKAKFGYNFLKVSTDAAANCLWINGTLIHRSSMEFPQITEDFASLDCPKIQLTNTELSKVDGALTCCSLLIN
ncbi:N(G),N(G)-dimethylarginine dimethylaminohydrolase 1-like [Rhopilema esculentum]|uniref:N(G),N(G)-dimethylarginine dimethylaminohydrolase 1-like n=1 Tax=Rhopilema esculentum TaxID=499914 RepID=UPI0031D5A3F2|eukprot:gene2815-1042_t